MMQLEEKWLNSSIHFQPYKIMFSRYVSVHHPLDYNQAMNDPAYIRKRLLKYFVPVVALAVTINLPKFFEIMPYWVPEEQIFGPVVSAEDQQGEMLQEGVEQAAEWAAAVAGGGEGGNATWNGESAF